MWNLATLIFAGLLIAVQSQLFDKPEFKSGGSFTLTCDVNRIGSVPTTVTDILFIVILRYLAPEKKYAENIAIYEPLGTENFTKIIPSGRRWEIKASGGIGSVDRTNNRKTIKIILHVPDAQCSDAGEYACMIASLQYPRAANRSEKLLSKDIPVLKLEESSGNASSKTTVRLTCRYEGIKGLALSWFTRALGGARFSLDPSKDDIKMVAPTFNNESFECGKYVSTLTFKPPDFDTFYICVIKDGEKELSQNSYKFIVKGANRGTHVGTSISTWFVRNMYLVMSVSAIIMCP